MTFGPEFLLARLDELREVAGRPGRYVVALSGGLDSTVLTHALATTTARHGVPLLAVHVDHGLHHDSADWAAHCAAFARQLKIPFSSRRVAVNPHSGMGLEAAAREARYAALRGLLEPGDWLLSAHHQDDQAETVLLNLMRSSGPGGLAGIRGCRPFAVGWLIRPLLDVPRLELDAYAREHELAHVVDPGNRDQQFDRNFLREQILPRFETRWPGAARRIRRSADLAREAATLLGELAAADRQELGDRPDCIDIRGLQALSPARQRNAVRHAIFELGLPLPGAVPLEQILTALVDARDDARPHVAWPGAVARRYRGRLYLAPADQPESGGDALVPVTGERVVLPAGLGVIAFEHGAATGLSDATIAAGLALGFRTGGERIKPENQKHTKKLKNLLQEAGIVPWMRDRLPLLFSDGELVAVGDLWIADSAVSSPGTALHWHNRPPLT